MVGITIKVETEDGKDHIMESESAFMSVLLTKLPRNLRNLVKKVENNGKKVINQEVLFIGDWNFVIINRFTKGLDKRGVKWKWEMSRY